MLNKNSLVLSLPVYLLCFSPVVAQISIDPGLWEMSMQVKTSSGKFESNIAKMHEQLAGMPEKNRTRIENALAERGMEMPSEDGAQTFRMCVTEEMASEFEMPIHQVDNCESEFEHTGGNVINITYVCETPPSEGEATIIVENSRAYSASMKIISSGAEEKEELAISYTGKWIAEDCGKVVSPVARAML